MERAAQRPQDIPRPLLQTYWNLLCGSHNAEGSRAAVAGDDTAGLDPGDFPVAQGCGFLLQRGTNTVIQIGCLDQIQVLLVQAVLYRKIP